MDWIALGMVACGAPDGGGAVGAEGAVLAASAVERVGGLDRVVWGFIGVESHGLAELGDELSSGGGCEGILRDKSAIVCRELGDLSSNLEFPSSVTDDESITVC